MAAASRCGKLRAVESEDLAASAWSFTKHIPPPFDTSVAFGSAGPPVLEPAPTGTSLADEFYCSKTRHMLLERPSDEEFAFEEFYRGQRYHGWAGDASDSEGDEMLGIPSAEAADWHTVAVLNLEDPEGPETGEESVGSVAWRGRLLGDGPDPGSTPAPALFLRRLHSVAPVETRLLTSRADGLVAKGDRMFVAWATGRVMGTVPAGMKVVHAATLQEFGWSVVLVAVSRHGRALAVLPLPGGVCPIDHADATHVFTLSAGLLTIVITIGPRELRAWRRQHGKWEKWASATLPSELELAAGGTVCHSGEAQDVACILIPCSGSTVLSVRESFEWERGRIVVEHFRWGRRCARFSDCRRGLLGVSSSGVWVMRGDGEVFHVLSPPMELGKPLLVHGDGSMPFVVCAKAAALFEWNDSAEDEGESLGIFTDAARKFDTPLPTSLRAACMGWGCEDMDICAWFSTPTGAAYGLELADACSPIESRGPGLLGRHPPASMASFLGGVAVQVAGDLHYRAPLTALAGHLVADELGDDQVLVRATAPVGAKNCTAASVARLTDGAVRLRVMDSAEVKHDRPRTVHTMRVALPPGSVIGCSLGGIGTEEWAVALASGRHVFVVRCSAGDRYRHARFQVEQSVEHLDFEDDGSALWLSTSAEALRIGIRAARAAGTLKVRAEGGRPAAGSRLPLAEPISAGQAAAEFGATTVAATRLGKDGEWWWSVRADGSTSLHRYDGTEAAGPDVPVPVDVGCCALWDEDDCVAVLLHPSSACWTTWAVRPGRAGAASTAASSARGAARRSAGGSPDAGGRAAASSASATRGLAFASGLSRPSRGRR